MRRDNRSAETGRAWAAVASSRTARSTTPGVANALSIQNLITPVGTQKIGTFEYTVNLQ
jgi:hypothetical protein